MTRIAVAEMIEELRRELKIAMDAGKGEDIRFEVGEVTIEAQVEVKKEAEGKAGIKFWLAEAGATGKASKAVTQKLVLKLEPQVDEGGKRGKLRVSRGTTG